MGWRVKIYFQQDDGSTLRKQLVAIEIYSNDIITEGYFDSLLFAIHFMNMGFAFCNTLYEHGIDGSQIVFIGQQDFENLIVNLTQLRLSSITPQ